MPVAIEPLPPMDRRLRLIRLREQFDLLDDRPHALLVTDLANIRYLTGFTGSAAMLLVTGDEVCFLTDGRYRVQSADQLAAAVVEATFVVGNRTEQAEELARLTAGRTVGFESATVTVAQLEGLRSSCLDARWAATTGLVESLRRHKDAGEVARIRAASAIAAAALHDALDHFDPSWTELDLAVRMESYMRLNGATGPSFDTIVAAGPRAALPHARPESVVIDAQPTVVDWGAVVDGYCSDTTRTVAAGAVDGEVVDAWHAVLAAQQAGLGELLAGNELLAVDRACRASLSRSGLDGYFTTGTGHGVGLHIHENPFIGTTSTGTIEVGDVITVEPGVYLPDRFGIRIEDFYLITAQGPERLSPARLAPLVAR